jgi:hypothetical protein
MVTVRVAPAEEEMTTRAREYTEPPPVKKFASGSGRKKVISRYDAGGVPSEQSVSPLAVSAQKLFTVCPRPSV